MENWLKSNDIVFGQNIVQDLNVKWLVYNFVHSRFVALPVEIFVNMSCHSNYLWLVFSAQFFTLEVSPYLFGGGDAVHNGHLDVCQNYRILEAQLLNHLDLINRLLTCDAEITLVLHIGPNLKQNSFH